MLRWYAQIGNNVTLVLASDNIVSPIEETGSRIQAGWFGPVLLVTGRVRDSEIAGYSSRGRTGSRNAYVVVE